MTVRHRAYYDGGSRYVYWDAPTWDPDGEYWEGPPSFNKLSQVRVINDEAVTTRSRPQQKGAQLTDGSNGPTSSPVGSGDSVGVNISSIPDANLYWVVSGASSSGVSSSIKVWLYDGNAWVPYADYDLSRSENRETLDSFQLEGGLSRVYVQITVAPSSGTLDVYVTPHNEFELTPVGKPAIDSWADAPSNPEDGDTVRYIGGSDPIDLVWIEPAGVWLASTLNQTVDLPLVKDGGLNTDLFNVVNQTGGILSDDNGELDASFGDLEDADIEFELPWVFEGVETTYNTHGDGTTTTSTARLEVLTLDYGSAISSNEFEVTSRFEIGNNNLRTFTKDASGNFVSTLAEIGGINVAEADVHELRHRQGLPSPELSGTAERYAQNESSSGTVNSGSTSQSNAPEFVKLAVDFRHSGDAPAMTITLASLFIRSR